MTLYPSCVAERGDAEQPGLGLCSHHQTLPGSSGPQPAPAPAAADGRARRARTAQAGPPEDGHHPGGSQHRLAHRRGRLREGPFPEQQLGSQIF